VLAQVTAMLVNGAENQVRLPQYLRTAIQPSIRADDDRAARPYVRVSPVHNSTRHWCCVPDHVHHDQQVYRCSPTVTASPVGVLAKQAEPARHKDFMYCRLRGIHLIAFDGSNFK
jgi:hypothetical protein